MRPKPDEATVIETPLLDLRGAATLVKLSPRTVSQLARRGILPCYKLGPVEKLLFKRDELLALLVPLCDSRSRRGPRPRLRQEESS